MNGALGTTPSVGKGHLLGAVLALATVLTVAAVMVVATAAAFAVPAQAGDAWALTQLTNDRYGESFVAADGSRVVFTRNLSKNGGIDSYTADNEVLLLDLATGLETNLSQNPDQSDFDAAISGDLVAWQAYDGRNRTIMLRDLAGGTTIALCAASAEDRAPRVAAGRVAWCAWDGNDMEVFLYDHATRTTTQITHNDREDGEVELTGDWLVWVGRVITGEPSVEPGGVQVDLYFYDLSTGVTTQFVRPGLQDFSPVVDGDRVVFTSASGSSFNLFLYDLSTQVTTRLTNDTFYEESARIAGDSIVWAGPGQDELWGVYWHRISSGVTTRVVDGAAGSVVALDAAGARVAWLGRQGQDWEVRVRDLVSAHTEQVTNAGAANSYPFFLGQRLLWLGDDGHDTELFSAVPASESPPDVFSDVPGLAPYRSAILAMDRAGIIQGYAVAGGREFRPDSPVTRAQFAKMICGALEIPVSEGLSTPFTDLGPDDPGDLFPHEYVAAALAYGITRGVTPTHFEPYASISRAQVVTMIVRATLALRPGLLEEPDSPHSGYVDDFDPTHAPNWALAKYNGLLGMLTGYRGHPDFWLPATRGEVAQMLWNLMGLEPAGGSVSGVVPG